MGVKMCDVLSLRIFDNIAMCIPRHHIGECLLRRGGGGQVQVDVSTGWTPVWAKAPCVEVL